MTPVSPEDKEDDDETYSPMVKRRRLFYSIDDDDGGRQEAVANTDSNNKDVAGNAATAASSPLLYLLDHHSKAFTNIVLFLLDDPRAFRSLGLTCVTLQRLFHPSKGLWEGMLASLKTQRDIIQREEEGRELI